MSDMISITEARAIIRQQRLPRRTEWMPLLLIREQILAEGVVAPFDSPRFDNSAMDGIAVQWSDVKKASTEDKIMLRLAGESSAGNPYDKTLRKNEAIRISTGAVIPEGADTVVPQEDCVFEEDRVMVLSVKSAGQHVRKRGEEYKEGHQLLDTGTLVTPAITGILGSVGMDPVKVYKSPVITLLLTGSELTRPTTDKKLREGEIYDSNQPMIVHYLRLAGIDNVRTIWVKDSLDDACSAIRHAQDRSDIILSTGGISVGPHDHIPAAAEQLGFVTMFTKVTQKPGKPFFFARNGDTLYFGLPGNPVSAFMLFTWYIYPEIRWYMGGEDELFCQDGYMVLSISNDRDRTLLLSALGFWENGQWHIKPLLRQASHKIRPLADANGFIIIPPQKSHKTGESVLFYFFPGHQEMIKKTRGI